MASETATEEQLAGHLQELGARRNVLRGELEQLEQSIEDLEVELARRAPAGEAWRICRLAAVRELHALNAVVVIAANGLAAGWGFVYLRRGRTPRPLYAHARARAGAPGRAGRAGSSSLPGDPDPPAASTALYGALALLAALSPWLYAPPVPAKRLLWFAGAALVVAALSVRAYATGT